MSRARRDSVDLRSPDKRVRRNAQARASRAKKREELGRKAVDLEEALASQRETRRRQRREIAELQATVAQLSGGEVSAASDAPSVSASDDTDAMPSSASRSAELTDDDEWKPPADEGAVREKEKQSNWTAKPLADLVLEVAHDANKCKRWTGLYPAQLARVMSHTLPFLLRTTNEGKRLVRELARWKKWRVRLGLTQESFSFFFFFQKMHC